MKKLFLVNVLVIFTILENNAQTVWARYNQAGYEPCRSKRVILMSNTNITGTAWTIKDGSNVTVLSGTIGASVSGTSVHMPKAFNYTVDFSTLTTIGNYTFNMTGITSPTLKILANPYEQYADQVLRYFKVHRSGTADCLDHTLSHPGDASCKIFRRSGTDNSNWAVDNAAATVDMKGGWYDAGDYIKFTLTCAYTTYNLLRAYELNPAIFQKKLYSQTSKVDILDEAHHGLEFLMKTMPSGRNEFIIQVGGAADHQQGNRLPENDALNGQREVYSAFSRTQMGYTAAALALGAKVFALIGETSDAARYQNQAIAIFTKAEASFVANAWWEGGGEVFYQDGTHQDNMALAAYELYSLTGTASYLTKAQTYANAAGSAYWASWGDANMMAHWRLYTIHTPSQTNFTSDLNSFRTTSTAAGNVWRIPHDYSWGSMYSFFGVANGAATYYLTTANNQYNNMFYDVLDYTFGMNNWGMAMIANNTTLPSAITVSYSQYYKMQPSLFPIGEIVQGPGDKATHDDLGFNYGATWENQFNTGTVVFYHRNNNYMTIETTIGGVSDGLVTLALASKVSGCTPLPVQFTGFNLSKNNQEVTIQWSTSSEQNSSSYKILHSSDGVNFTEVGTVPAAGNSNSLKEYSFIHVSPIPGVNYYKIVQEDLNGNLHPTEIKSISLEETTDVISFPNPFSTETLLKTKNMEIGSRLELRDVSGKILQSELFQGQNEFILGQSLPPGIYFLRIASSEHVYTEKLIKQ